MKKKIFWCILLVIGFFITFYLERKFHSKYSFGYYYIYIFLVLTPAVQYLFPNLSKYRFGGFCKKK